MKKYTIEISDDLATIYEDIAKYHEMCAEEAIQMVLKRVIGTFIAGNSRQDTDTNPTSNSWNARAYPTNPTQTP